ncbi:MAG: molybdopterin molybdotransferase MoeA [Planctomycetota bacterium]|jgi:molybdopterin molybdotransferase
MLAFEEALQIVLSSSKQLGSECLDLFIAYDRILAKDVTSDIDMPPFDKSAMDGYACRRKDLANELLIIESIPAGHMPGKTIEADQCAKIMTGGMVPQGADCVVMVEQTERPTAKTMRFIGEQASDNICPKAEDVSAGQVVLRKGTRIRPQHIATLAAVGCSSVCVSRLPEVGVISTGDELVTPDEKPGPCQIRETNSYQISAHARQTGAIVSNYGIVADRKHDIDRMLQKAIAENDVVVLSGGVSAGDYDYVPGIMKQIGIDVLFQKVAIKPGRPTVFGMCEDTYCFGLPGNPVAGFVVFELLVKPFLYKMMGHDYRPTCACVPLALAVTRKNTERQSWIPVAISDDLEAKPVKYHGSANITALCDADGLICIDKGVAELEKGKIVQVRLI